MGRIIILALLLFALNPNVSGRQGPAADSAEHKFMKDFEDLVEAEEKSDKVTGATASDSSATQMVKYSRRLEIARHEAAQAKHEYEKSKYQYYAASLKNRENLFGWQYWSSRIIFWVVIAIVVSGLVFSGIQFYISIKDFLTYHKAKSLCGIQPVNHSQPAGLPATDSGTNPVVTNIELSLQGVKISSSIIGLLILVIAIAFFYLYLIYVYPITEAKIDVLKQVEKPEQGEKPK